MAIPIEMPKLGNTVEECLLAKWKKRPGDAVTEGEILAEVETDKATFELASTASGTLIGVFFEEGDLVPVFTNVCVVGSPGESFEQFRTRVDAAPAETRVEGAAEIEQSPGRTSRGSYSPRARRFAEEHDFWPEQVEGSGPGGRVLAEDIRRLYFASPRMSAPAKKALADEGGEKLAGVREKIARRMRESLGSTAQYTMHASADATRLMALRAAMKAREVDITINDMVMFCAVKALELMPEVNVEIVGGAIRRHAEVNIGFACDTPRGLLVPVVKEAQRLSLEELASRIRELSAQAVGGAISPDYLTGGTFTVSNLGVYGIESFTPILNAPQAAILGVDAIALKPVRRNGQVEFVEHIGLSLTCDHQAIDGAPGAKFLKIVREQIEGLEI